MPSLNLRFDRFDRPIVSVDVRPALVHQQQLQNSIPHAVPSATVDFLVDTGAAECVIEEDVISAWLLPKAMPVVV